MIDQSVTAPLTGARWWSGQLRTDELLAKWPGSTVFTKPASAKTLVMQLLVYWDGELPWAWNYSRPAALPMHGCAAMPRKF
jgi:hypothetical protein